MNKILVKYWFLIWVYLIFGGSSVIAAQLPNTTSVYIGISLNKKLDPDSAAVAPGPFLTKFFDPLFVHVGGHAKNNLHMTFFHGTAARVACYAARNPGGKKQIKCYATGEPITAQEGKELNERLEATYKLTLNTLLPANPLKVTLNLTPRYKESSANKYFVMLDFDAISREALGKVLNVFRLFLSHKTYNLTLPLPEKLIHFPLEEDIEKLSNTAQAQTDHFRAMNHPPVHYVQIVKSGVPVSLEAPICCSHSNQGIGTGCIDINQSLDSAAPENTKCFIIGAKKWYTGEKPPSSHVTLADHTIGFPNLQNLKTLIGSTVHNATQIKRLPLALTSIKNVWAKVPENVIKGAVFLTITRNMLCQTANGTVNGKVKARLDKILPSDSRIAGKDYATHWGKACRSRDIGEYFNDDSHLKEYGQYRPAWDNYITEKSTLFNNFSDLTHWLIDNRISFDLKELDFHS
ncbi:hypothetical protein [Candidatus Odyssella acanthamoebae]|uniref:Uncharacterized protein n=1 Tax=Candidatus Odyssella acanthamoebae TaxID=91604 RepID=A0A077AYZ5_9PROT|nr:hypothetical protein [Candidatus Paracaedibacter acanthamoebae]AIK97234.1 hypothetical protein ID47_11585 [Candidatus Paracaedibacter acanthamoebae]